MAFAINYAAYKTVADVVKMTSAYFDLDVEIWVETGALEDSLAECENHGAGVFTIHLNKEFLESEDEAELVRVVAHEMVHVKQFEQDNLCLEDSMYSMHGVEYNGDYWFSPWEIEARGYQDAFLQHFYSSNAEKTS